MLHLRFINNTKEANKALENIQVDPSGIKMMNSKALHYTIKVEDLQIKAALILKQDMLSIGGEVALPRDVMNLKDEKTTAILMATKKQYEKLIDKIKEQPFGLKQLSEELTLLLINIEKQHNSIKAYNFTLNLTKPLIMGIINVTPDSFSDGNEHFSTEKAVEHAKKLIQDGANIIDIGGESTKPGSESITVEEELNRVLPVIQKLVQDNINIQISIDTYKPEVADKCLQAGATILNDITTLQNEKMRTLANKHQCPVIIMHMQGTPKDMQTNPEYNDVVDDIINFLSRQIKVAEASGITNIVVDPGIGFGKTVQDNLTILNRLNEFKILGKPILIGLSRKAFIGKVNNTEVDNRLEGTLAANTIALQNKTNIIRVHDVKEHKKVLEIFNAIQYGENHG